MVHHVHIVVGIVMIIAIVVIIFFTLESQTI